MKSAIGIKKRLKAMSFRDFRVFGSIFITLIIFASCFSVLNNYFLDDTFQHQIARYLFNKPSISDYLRHSQPGVYLRPIPFLSWVYNYTIFGPNPIPYHLIILILHSLSSILFFILILHISKNKYFSLFTGIIFAIHPISSEVVARVINRDDIFCMIFYLVSIISFSLSYKKRAYYLLSLASFIVSLLCKEMALSLPLTIVIYDLIFPNQNTSPKNTLTNRVKLYIPYFVILLIYLIVKFLAPTRGTYGYLIMGHPPFYWIFKKNGLIKGSLNYLLKTIFLPYKFLLFPINKFVFKDYIKVIKISISLILCIPIIISSIFNFRKFFNRITVFGFLFVFLNAIPTCFLLGAIDYNKGGLINSRYLYMASGGFSVIIAGCLYSISFKKDILNKLIRHGLIFCTIVLYTILLTGNNSAFNAASKVAYQIPLQTKKLHPFSPEKKKIIYFIPSKDELYFCKGEHLYMNGGLDISLSIAYGFPLEAYIIDKEKYFRHKLDSGNKEFNRVMENFDLREAILDGYVLKWDPERNKVVDLTQNIKNKLKEKFSEGKQNFQDSLLFINSISDWYPETGLDSFRKEFDKIVIKLPAQENYLHSPPVNITLSLIKSIEIKMKISEVKGNPNMLGTAIFIADKENKEEEAYVEKFNLILDEQSHIYNLPIRIDKINDLDTRIIGFRLILPGTSGKAEISSIRVLPYDLSVID